MLVSLAEMKSYLNIADTSQDVFLTAQLNLVSEVVEAYCRRSFESRIYEQTFYREDYRSSQLLQTFHYPIISVDTVVEDDVELSSDDYRVHNGSGSLLRKNYGNFFRAEETVVTYTSGFATIPGPVKSVVFSLVEERYNKKSSGVNLNFGSDVQRISIPGSISIDFDYSLSNNDRKVSFGVVLGSNVNILDYYRSDRAVLGNGRLMYVQDDGTYTTPTFTRMVTGTDTISAQADRKLILNDVTVEDVDLTFPPGENGITFEIGFASTNAATWTAVAVGSDAIDAYVQENLEAGNNLLVTFLDGTWYLA